MGSTLSMGEGSDRVRYGGGCGRVPMPLPSGPGPPVPPRMPPQGPPPHPPRCWGGCWGRTKGSRRTPEITAKVGGGGQEWGGIPDPWGGPE